MGKGGVFGAVAVAVLAAAASAFPETLQLERGSVLRGDWWRLWTGHFVHASRDHLVFDAGAACLLFIGLGDALRWSLRLLVMAPVVSIVLLAALPDLEYYYGLSGLLHAWAVWGAGALWRGAAPRLNPWLAATFGLGTAAKAGWETWSGAALLSGDVDMGGAIIFAAHLVGAVVGFAGLCAFWSTRPGGVSAEA